MPRKGVETACPEQQQEMGHVFWRKEPGTRCGDRRAGRQGRKKGGFTGFWMNPEGSNRKILQ